MAEEKKILAENELDENQLNSVSGGTSNSSNMTQEEMKRDFWFKGGIEENCK